MKKYWLYKIFDSEKIYGYFTVENCDKFHGQGHSLGLIYMIAISSWEEK